MPLNQESSFIVAPKKGPDTQDAISRALTGGIGYVEYAVGSKGLRAALASESGADLEVPKPNTRRVIEEMRVRVNQLRYDTDIYQTPAGTRWVPHEPTYSVSHFPQEYAGRWREEDMLIASLSVRGLERLYIPGTGEVLGCKPGTLLFVRPNVLLGERRELPFAVVAASMDSLVLKIGMHAEDRHAADNQVYLGQYGNTQRAA